MEKKKMISKALKIMLSAHEGQVDKGGSPYYLHPLRVATSLGIENEKEFITALLHDAFEDSSIYAEYPDFCVKYFREEFGDQIVDAMLTLTHTEDETYDQYIDRVLTNEIARSVKYADLMDNLSASRAANISDSKRKRYRAALDKILNFWGIGK